MSVTNDPNYHEGQPAFGPTDAVRPTGETGARCPWCGSEMRATMQAAKFIIGAQAKCTNSHCCARGPLVHDGTKEAALAAARARPLPDFPAGAPGPWRSSPHFDYHLRDANNVYVGGVSYSVDRERCIEIRDFILDVRRAISEYRKILSSRATGAEVEIREPTDAEYDEMAIGTAYGGDEEEFRTHVNLGLAYARRHATTRPGGGVTDDSAMEEGRMEEIEARCNEATPGPWSLMEEKPEFGVPYFAAISGDGNRTRCAELFMDADFIAHARTDIPDLLAEVRRLRRRLDYPDFAPGPWSECGGFIVDANDAPVFEIVSEESHHKIAIRNFMDQLQAPRKGDHPCRELVQEIADSKICWSDWAGDYIQWTEDITRKARKALGLKDE